MPYDDLGETMEVDFIFKIAGVGLIIAVINTVLTRSGREEQAMLSTIAGVIVVLMMIVPELAELFDTIKSLFDL